MDFWTEMTHHCLQDPWFIQPQGWTPELSLTSQRLFVIPENLSDEAYTMMGKMVAALNYQPGDVMFLEMSPAAVEELTEQPASLKIVFFGGAYPGRFGEALHWGGHQVIQTHDFNTLMERPETKRETWGHLQAYSGLS